MIYKMSRTNISGISQHFNIKYVLAQQSIFYTAIRPRFITAPMSRMLYQSQRAYSPSTYKQNGRLHGRTAMITGGSSGIGYATAEHFLAEGASKVILVGRSHEKLQDASRRLTESVAAGASRNGDVATRAPEEDVSERTTSSGSRIEILIGDISVASEWMSELEKAMVTWFSQPSYIASY